MPDTVIRDGFECCQDGGYRTSRRQGGSADDG